MDFGRCAMMLGSGRSFLEDGYKWQTYIRVALLMLQPFGHFTYVTTHSPTLPSLYLRHSLFCNPSVASPTSQFILQLFFRFSYATSSSLNSPEGPPMENTYAKLSRGILVIPRGTQFENHCQSETPL